MGLLSSSLLVGTALLVSLTYRIVPSLSEEFIRGLAWGLCGLAGCSVVALRSNKVLAEFHQGRLYLQFDVPYENGSALPEGGVQVASKAWQRILSGMLEKVKATQPYLSDL